MIRWVVAIFVALFVFFPLLPWLERLRVGHLPGDVRFSFRGIVFCFPFGSALVWSAIAFLIAELVSWSGMFG
ncbi:MAG TPA: DUF2905 domain-containing protein [Noviherbaspirillum sp.]